MISQASIDKITAASSPVESFKAVLDALVEDQTIKLDHKGLVGLIKLQLDNHKDELNPAITANASF